jgi:protein-S-isoprenylcysteine O-methyltransferase Ste14
MKVEKLLTILSILIIFFCIIPILNIIIHFEVIIDNYNGYLELIILFSSIILSVIILMNAFLKKLIFCQILFSMMIFGLNLGILIYFTINIPYFWVNTLIGLMELKLSSIVSILCSMTIALLSNFQIESKKIRKSSIEDLKNRIKFFYLRLTTFVVYIPIIAGILYPMTVMPALAYISWNIFYLWPGIDLISSWIVHINYSQDFTINLLLWSELIIFTCGFALFFYGLIHLARNKKEKIDIAQSGPYKLIRHPQNFGIIIFSFPFSLYIKVGDIFSWMLFVLLTIIYSDIEEIQMLKKYQDIYNLYKAKTGFFIPKIIKSKKEESKLKIENYIFRWIFLIGGYILLISILTFVFSKFPLLNLRDFR